MRAILGQLAARTRLTFEDDLVDRIWSDILQRSGPDGALQEVVSRLAQADPRPLVLLIDEIDALVGDTLLSVLRQLRTGYDPRPDGFPQSVVLCGVRDVRDYRIHSSTEKAVVAGGSAFNVKARSPAHGRLLPRRGARPPGAAHRRDGTGVRARRHRNHLGPDPGPAMAGQRPGRRSLLPGRGGPRPQPPDPAGALRHRVQGAPQEPGADHPRRAGADRRLHGPLRRRGRPSRRGDERQRGLPARFPRRPDGSECGGR